MERDIKGNLVKYSSVGSYPIAYYTKGGDCLCCDCANKEESDSKDPIVESEANWENPDLYCDACGERVESAYAEE